jgi:transposase-like protein
MARNQALSIPKLIARTPDEESAYKLLEELRWGNPVQPVCPHCGSDRKHYFLTPRNGVGRVTGPNKTISVRRVWKCAACRKQFSVLTGTIFHGSKIPVRTWLLVVFEMVSSKNGVSAREIERKYDLTPKSAWFMTMRIREAMKRGPLADMMRGTIIADETFFGGKDKNRHANKRSGRGQTMNTKTPVVSLINRETGEVRSQVSRFVAGPDLTKAIEAHVVPADSVLHTDGWQGYVGVGRQFQSHEMVDHNQGEYVRGNVTTNQVEGFFSQLKRSIDGTHHRVSVDHLPRYLDEFDFRWSTRKLDDAQRMARLIGQTAGRRLTYRRAV